MNHLLVRGDSRRIPLADKSVHCVVTSPPYFGLRNYGTANQIGLEETPDAYVAALVGVFREVHRVLRDDGVCWLNLGDSYNAYNGNRGKSTSFSAASEGQHPVLPSGHGLTAKGFKNKDRLGIPHRVVFALQSDGWYWRDEIVWAKPNPMPESVTDRTTKSHEIVFLLSKKEKYFYNNEAVKEPMAAASAGRYAYSFRGAKNIALAEANVEGVGRRTSVIGDRAAPIGRNLRSVWTITSKPYKGAHFATMPVDLAERCIKAGSPVGGIVFDPFNGAGTTGVAATQLGRHYIGTDLNPAYLAMSVPRIAQGPQVKKRAVTKQRSRAAKLNNEYDEFAMSFTTRGAENHGV